MKVYIDTARLGQFNSKTAKWYMRCQREKDEVHISFSKWGFFTWLFAFLFQKSQYNINQNTKLFLKNKTNIEWLRKAPVDEEDPKLSESELHTFSNGLINKLLKKNGLVTKRGFTSWNHFLDDVYHFFNETAIVSRKSTLETNAPAETTEQSADAEKRVLQTEDLQLQSLQKTDLQAEAIQAEGLTEVSQEKIAAD